jgi:ABC-2 type transport system ATP-binding protein
MYVELKNVSKIINKVPILTDISVRFDGGKVYGLRGKNGSGKTMLMRAVCGLILIDSGEIDINGEILGKQLSFPRSIGALIENPGFIAGYTGFENLKMLASIQARIGDDKIRESITEVGLDPDDKRKFRKYSLGMKQKLGIACACMEDPDILILDEPINAIDEEGVVLVRNLLLKAKQRGAVIIVSSHDREELDLLADEIYLMKDGRITDKISEKPEVNYE